MTGPLQTGIEPAAPRTSHPRQLDMSDIAPAAHPRISALMRAWLERSPWQGACAVSLARNRVTRLFPISWAGLGPTRRGGWLHS